MCVFFCSRGLKIRSVRSKRDTISFFLFSEPRKKQECIKVTDARWLSFYSYQYRFLIRSSKRSICPFGYWKNVSKWPKASKFKSAISHILPFIKHTVPENVLHFFYLLYRFWLLYLIHHFNLHRKQTCILLFYVKVYASREFDSQ